MYMEKQIKKSYWLLGVSAFFLFFANILFVFFFSVFEVPLYINFAIYFIAFLLVFIFFIASLISNLVKFRKIPEQKKHLRNLSIFGFLTLVMIFVFPLLLKILQQQYFNIMPGKPPKDGIEKTWKDYDKITSFRECKYYGGKWHTWSYWQGDSRECDMPYPDGGKTCRDSSDCTSEMCLYDYEKQPGFGYYTEGEIDKSLIGTESEGNCAEWVSTSCINHSYFIEEGKIVEEFCLE